MSSPPNSPTGPEETTDTDRAYTGSSYREVRDAVFANPYYRVWGAPNEPALPMSYVGFWTLFRGLIRESFSWRGYRFFRAATRTVDTRIDLRWGEDGKGVQRLLHPNGVCLTGLWEITQQSSYTGYFQQGRQGLVVARYSTGLGCLRGELRTLSLVGKLFPTTDAASTELFRPAGFITQKDLGGHWEEYFNDADSRNTPDVSGLRRGCLTFPTLLLLGFVFGRADKVSSERQLHEIAELGKPIQERTRSPKFLRFVVDESQPRIPGEKLDFRDEILAQIYDRGDPMPRRELVFHIEVSDEGTQRGPAFQRKWTIDNWYRIGRLVFREAVASYNGDFVVHFHHPGWRIDRNDPGTVVRQGERRVR
ncbi:MAG: hypothetical protein K8U57_26280 [Planctomycetes bacterium]|nr:hypothetical protein [Planctomycetota bacterium]